MSPLLFLALHSAVASAQQGGALADSAARLRPVTVQIGEDPEVVDTFQRPVSAVVFAELQGHDVLADAIRQKRRSQRNLGWGLFSGGAIVFLSGVAGTGAWNENTQQRGRWVMLAGVGLLGAGSRMVLTQDTLRVSSWYESEELQTGVDWINVQPLQRWTHPHLRVVDDPRNGWRIVDESGVSWSARDLALASSDPRTGVIARAERRELTRGIVACGIGGYLLLVGGTFAIVGATVEPENGLWTFGTVAAASGALLVSRGVSRLRHRHGRQPSEWYTREAAEQWVDWMNANPRASGRPQIQVGFSVAPIPQGVGAGVQLTW